MTEFGSTGETLRGKSLHPEMARRVTSLYNSGHYEEAVLAAFKVIEERLRDITGKSDAGRKDLLKETFNPTSGTLQDPKAWTSERQGIYNFFDGAFLSFRNPPAHKFVETDAEEAFDLIVLANRMLIIVEDRHRTSRLGPIASYTVRPERLLSLLGANQRYTAEPILLDADGDGELELISPGGEGGEIIRVSKKIEGVTTEAEVERSATHEGATHVVMNITDADVDNDGQREIVCTVNAGNQPWALMFYKYRNGRYELLKAVPQYNGWAWYSQEAFLRAHIADINEDGEVEVVSEPKTGGAMPPPVRYVWKWNENEGVFQLLHEEKLTYDFPLEGRK